MLGEYITTNTSTNINKFIEDGHQVQVTLEGIQEEDIDEAYVADVSAIVGVEHTVKKKVSQLAVEKIRQAEASAINMGSYVEDCTACM